MPMPKVSLVVVAYNIPNEIVDCIQSIKNQSLHDFECICIDNASTDQTPQMLEKAIDGDPRFNIIRLGHNGILGGARNAGLKAAKSEYVYFVDGDDLLHPQTLEIMVHVMQKSVADVGCCYFKKFHNVSELEFTSYDPKEVPFELYDEPFKSYIHNSRIPTSSWKIYRRDILDGISFQEDVFYEDLYHTCKVLIKAEKLVLVKEQLYMYFQRPNSIMASSFDERRYKDFITCIESSAEVVANEAPSLLAEARKYRFNPMLKMLLNQIKKKQKDEQKRQNLLRLLQNDLPLLLSNGSIDFNGIKWKHAITLKLLTLFKNPHLANLWMKIF